MNRSGCLDKPYSAKPAQQSSHTGPACSYISYIGWVPAYVDWRAGTASRRAALADCKMCLKLPQQVISDAGRSKLDFAERDQYRPVFLLSG